MRIKLIVKNIMTIKVYACYAFLDNGRTIDANK